MKNMIFLRYVLWITVVLHFGPFYKNFECTLVIKPANDVAVSGEFVILRCASNIANTDSIAWRIPGLRSPHYIYDGSKFSPEFSSYITLIDARDGNFSLNITASANSARRYTCLETKSGETSDAELIVLENSTTANVFLSIVFAGNLDTVVTCIRRNASQVLIELLDKENKTIVNNVATRTWNFETKEHLTDILIKDSDHIIKCFHEFADRSTNNIHNLFYYAKGSCQKLEIGRFWPITLSILTIIFISSRDRCDSALLFGYNGR